MILQKEKLVCYLPYKKNAKIEIRSLENCDVKSILIHNQSKKFFCSLTEPKIKTKQKITSLDLRNIIFKDSCF